LDGAHFGVRNERHHLPVVALTVPAYCRHGSYPDVMGVAITVRDVPDEVRDELAARAARSGKSLQEYLRGELVELASRPTVADVVGRARARVHTTGSRLSADAILSARDTDRR
jgi:hypothetical protein